MWIVDYWDKKHHQANAKEIRKFHTQSRKFGIVYHEFVSYHETQLDAINALDNFKELCEKRIKEFTTE